MFVHGYIPPSSSRHRIYFLNNIYTYIYIYTHNSRIVFLAIRFSLSHSSLRSLSAYIFETTSTIWPITMVESSLFHGLCYFRPPTRAQSTSELSLPLTLVCIDRARIGAVGAVGTVGTVGTVCQYNRF